jgi:hypothetical protein
MFEEGQVLSGVKQQFNVRDAIMKMTMLPDITLNAQEADKFWEGVWDQTSIKNFAQKVTMQTQKKDLRHLGLTERIMHPEGTMDSSKIVTTILENKVQLSTVESRAAILIKDADLEDMNIVSAAEFKSAVMRIIQNKLANEVEEWLWISESETDMSSFGADDIRSTMDGWRYQLDYSQSGETYENSVTGSAVILDASNTVTAAAEDFGTSSTDGPVEFDSSAPYHPDFKLGYFLPNMPSQYYPLIPQMKFFMNHGIWWKELQHERKLGTEIAHRSLSEGGVDKFDNVDVVLCANIPVTMAIYSSGQKEKLDTSTPGDLTDILLTPANNLVFGVQLDLMMEVERSAASRGNIYWFTIRGDAKIRDVNACVFGKRFKVV